MRPVAASVDGRPHPAPPTQLNDICRLSEIATELVAMRQRLTVGDEAGEGLAGIVADLDATVTALLHVAPPSADGHAANVGHGVDPPQRAWASRERLGIDQSVFLAWLADAAMPDQLAASPEGSGEPVSCLLGRLSTSSRGLTADAAMLVGMPAGTTMGDASVALLLAVEDPAGPRCRSYRAAASYLQDVA